MAEELHVVSIAEFNERHDDLVREVHDTRNPLFIMDGDEMVARILPPEVSLDDIRQSLALMDEMDRIPEEGPKTWTNAVEVVNEQRSY